MLGAGGFDIEFLAKLFSNHLMIGFDSLLMTNHFTP